MWLGQEQRGILDCNQDPTQRQRAGTNPGLQVLKKCFTVVILEQGRHGSAAQPPPHRLAGCTTTVTTSPHSTRRGKRRSKKRCYTLTQTRKSTCLTHLGAEGRCRRGCGSGTGRPQARLVKGSCERDGLGGLAECRLPRSMRLQSLPRLLPVCRPADYIIVRLPTMVGRQQWRRHLINTQTHTHT